jgi:hypothetical protein
VLGCNRGADSSATESNPTASGAALSAAPAASNVGQSPGGPLSISSAGANAAERELSPLINAELPHDVDPAVLERLQKEGKAAEIQALYERFSWQSLVALQWPRDANGKPAPNPSGPGTPAWMSYKESFLVFQSDGAKPAPWEAPRAPANKTITPLMGALPESVQAKERVVFNVGAKPRRTTANELDQAFTFPLWDQSGNVIHYEILLNRSEFEYLVANELYNIDGQIEFSKRNPGKDLDPSNCNHPNSTVVVMPSGAYGAAEPGAVELKLAWKVLTEKDIPERYIVAEGRIPASIKISGTCAKGDVSASIEGQAWKKVTLGLVGLHISHKTVSGPQWVWSTFEQVDNLAVDAVEAERYAAQGKRLGPTFNDPNCETCVVNACAVPPEKNQLQRVIPIPEETAALNRTMQTLLGAQGSALRYYELVGVQYPTAKDAKPTSPRAEPKCTGPEATPLNLPQSVSNKPGGMPHTAFLTNLTMESFFQTGNQPACNEVENGNCPAKLPSTAPNVFATESCMGCHSSAGIAVSGTPNPGTQQGANFGHQLTADFSWLLQQKAYWKK